AERDTVVSVGRGLIPTLHTYHLEGVECVGGGPDRSLAYLFGRIVAVVLWRREQLLVRKFADRTFGCPTSGWCVRPIGPLDGDRLVEGHLTEVLDHLAPFVRPVWFDVRHGLSV